MSSNTIEVYVLILHVVWSRSRERIHITRAQGAIVGGKRRSLALEGAFFAAAASSEGLILLCTILTSSSRCTIAPLHL
jgi:hypothetical protein